jgi:hypothetical protein
VVGAVREQLLHRRRRVVGGAGVDEVRGAEAERLGLLGGVHVDGHDPASCGDGRSLEHVEADAAGADDHDGLAGLDLRPVEHGADPGDHAAAHEAGARERDLVGDDDGLVLEDDGLLAEHAGVGELERLVAPDRERTAEAAHGVAAVGGLTPVARRARAAVPERGEHDVVALGDAAHAVGDLDHDAGTLVPEHDGSGERDVAVHDRDVGVAEPGGFDAHPHLAAAQAPQLDVVADLELTGPDQAVQRHGGKL